jgi:CelD/BcsL family acetyltransferase involved in cellulose biosynthesis
MSCARAFGLPLPALVSADNYSALCTPLIDADASEAAVIQLLDQARQAGAHGLVLREIPIEGPALAAFARVLEKDGLKPRLLQSYARACLNASNDAEALPVEALGPKKLKDIRRLRKRLAETGPVQFTRAQSVADVAGALDTFLALESSGWKGQRGTALSKDAGDTAFIRSATASLAARGQCEIITLSAGATAIASAIVIKHQNRAFYYKIGIDERFAKVSPGVQLTVELTRAMCAEPGIALVDSTAGAGNGLVDPIWRGRLVIGDVFIPLRRHDPLGSLTCAALATRLRLREPIRHAVRQLRNWRKKQRRTGNAG